MTQETKEYLTINGLVKDPICPFSAKALRWHVWRAGVNGLAPAIFRIGRKIVISRSGFLDWLTSHQRKAK